MYVLPHEIFLHVYLSKCSAVDCFPRHDHMFLVHIQIMCFNCLALSYASQCGTDSKEAKVVVHVTEPYVSGQFSSCPVLFQIMSSKADIPSDVHQMVRLQACPCRMHQRLPRMS